MKHRGRLTLAATATVAALVSAWTPACNRSGSKDSAAAAASAAPIGISECAACGMVVREQPAPRGQVVHRDGTRVFLCSIGDLVQYLQSPSPHGSATDVFVEALGADDDPTAVDSRERSFIRADSASYVVGIKRPNVMGRPVLVYESEVSAAKARALPGAQPMTWAEVQRWVLER